MAMSNQQPSSPESQPQPIDKNEKKARSFNELEKLFRMYGKYAFSVAKQSSLDDQTAEEIVHETYLKYWNSIDYPTQNLTSVTFLGWLLREIKRNCNERILEYKTPNVRRNES